MEIAKNFTASRQVQNLEVKSYDMTIILGYAIFAIVFLAAVYFDSVSPGTALGDFASMTVLP
jgi:hypothetical protein